jgi:hypothetical protein
VIGTGAAPLDSEDVAEDEASPTVHDGISFDARSVEMPAGEPLAIDPRSSKCSPNLDATDACRSDSQPLTGDETLPPLPPWRDESQLKVALRSQAPVFVQDTSLASLIALLEAATVRLCAQEDKSSPELALPRELVARHTELQGLPYRPIAEHRGKVAEVAMLDQISRAIRATGGSEEKILKLLATSPEWESPEAIAALEQTLQVESPAVRSAMIITFSAIPGEKASQAIARRALYDLNPEVRSAALTTLARRNPAGYRATLLEGLRHPWEQVAWNAAEAVARLGDAEVVPQLIALLDAPAPTEPFQDESGQWRVRELAALGHLSNCAVCHAVSISKQNPVRSIMPDPNLPLNDYYPTQVPRPGVFVRADVTYLKQDFSVMQSVATPGVWPREQRVDYLVRERKLTDDQRMGAVQRSAASGDPHRQALLYALHRLTGLDERELSALNQRG